MTNRKWIWELWTKNTATAEAPFRLLAQHIFPAAIERDTLPHALTPSAQQQEKESHGIFFVLFTAKVNNKLVYEMQCNLLPNIFDLIKCVCVPECLCRAYCVLLRCYCHRCRSCCCWHCRIPVIAILHQLYHRNNKHYNELRSSTTYCYHQESRSFFCLYISFIRSDCDSANQRCNSSCLNWVDWVRMEFSSPNHRTKYSWFSSNALTKCSSTEHTI